MFLRIVSTASPIGTGIILATWFTVSRPEVNVLYGAVCQLTRPEICQPSSSFPMNRVLVEKLRPRPVGKS